MQFADGKELWIQSHQNLHGLTVNNVRRVKTNKNNYTIRLETKDDYREVENLTWEAFWSVYRPGCIEHYVLHCYRDRADFVP